MALGNLGCATVSTTEATHRVIALIAYATSKTAYQWDLPENLIKSAS
jgi:hypothetical protein